MLNKCSNDDIYVFDLILNNRNIIYHIAIILKKGVSNCDRLVLLLTYAPFHERSESWKQRYGSKTSAACTLDELEDTKFSQLWLKGLFCNFTTRLNAGMPPVVSSLTQSKVRLLDSWMQLYKKSEQEFIDWMPNGMEGRVGVPRVYPLGAN